MSDARAAQLEQQLADLTTWDGPAPGLWRRALASAAPSQTADVLRRRISPWLLAGLATAAVLLLIGVFARPFAFTDVSARARVDGSAFQSPDPTRATAARSGADIAAEFWQSDGDGRVAADFLGGRRGGGPAPSTGAPSGGAGQSPTAPTLAEGLVPRQVVRKATVELATKDVRAAFLKAAQLISEARGEYVQDSSLTGSGERMSGNLTLRVTAERLSDVLNELRELGDVRAERIVGEDVTAQAVDLEARLRNEQRAETELLRLLEKRTDAPLKEILELRSTITEVRQTIEQLTAQRDQLSRLVGLATVLVIIRASDGPPPSPASGLLDYFSDALRSAWNVGARFLANTVAALVAVLVGGLLWWTIVAVIAVIWWVRRRRIGQPSRPVP